MTIGAGCDKGNPREKNDYYATEPRATIALLENETFSKHVLEPCCGEGHMSDVLASYGYDVTSSDVIDRGYGDAKDFLAITEWKGDIVTNPPFKHAKDFVEHALEIVEDGSKVAMLLRLLFLEGKNRRKLFDTNPPKKVYVFSDRVICSKNGDFETFNAGALAYAWFVWEKGYQGKPEICWITASDYEREEH